MHGEYYVYCTYRGTLPRSAGRRGVERVRTYDVGALINSSSSRSTISVYGTVAREAEMPYYVDSTVK